MDMVKLLEAFRDFFHYGREQQMRAAYCELLALVKRESEVENINWELEEFTFNRLFVGPMRPLAPPVASVYLDPEGLIQGPVTAEIRLFYTSIGLCLENVGGEPEDSLAYELDACRHLLLLGRKASESLEVYRNFIIDHMARWVPEFCARAKEHCLDSVAVRDVLVLLSEWVEGETGNVTQQKERA